MTILIRITDSSNNRDMNNLNRSICLVESIFDPYNHHTKIQLHLKKKKSRFYINYFSNIVFHLHNFSRKIKKKKITQRRENSPIKTDCTPASSPAAPHYR